MVAVYIGKNMHKARVCYGNKGVSILDFCMTLTSEEERDQKGWEELFQETINSWTNSEGILELKGIGSGNPVVYFDLDTEVGELYVDILE
jgi:hypothetical protein